MQADIRCPPKGARAIRGVAAIEALLALPVVLLTGLGALQFGLVLHARQAVMHSVIEGARSGTLNHAQPQAIERGFARGLSPWLYGASSAADHQAAIQRTQAHLSTGISQGWVRWRQLSPTTLSFDDWAVPILDAQGVPIPGTQEIPVDNLPARALVSEPRSGRLVLPAGAGSASTVPKQAPIGLASGQTLADANLLKIELTYGVPLSVPLVGRIGAWVMRVWDGCEQASGKRLGAVDLGRSQVAALPRGWACPFYAARSPRGDPQPRWPVRVVSTGRMQKAARAIGASVAGVTLPVGYGLGPGDFDVRSVPAPVADAPEAVAAGWSPPGTPDPDGLAPGFLKVGGATTLSSGGLCLSP